MKTILFVTALNVCIAPSLQSSFQKIATGMVVKGKVLTELNVDTLDDCIVL